MQLDEPVITLLSPGLTQTASHQGGIMQYTFHDIHQETIDLWAATLHKVVNGWDPHRPFLTLHDYSQVENMAFTPYIRTKAQEMTNVRPELKGRTALVLQPTLITSIVRLFLKNNRSRLRARQIFFKRADAVAWLEELLPKS